MGRGENVNYDYEKAFDVDLGHENTFWGISTELLLCLSTTTYS